MTILTRTSPPRSITFSPESLDEAQHATIHTGNTSPGADSITVNLLKPGWHIVDRSHALLSQQPQDHAGYRHGDVEKPPEPAYRRVGDSRLPFRVHVEKWAAKAHAVAYHLRGLANTKALPSREVPSWLVSSRYYCMDLKPGTRAPPDRDGVSL
ncbi:uncharacterized protein FPRO_16085 [Fusarium proliferatum ET1]|uniref:Uncharacterized protein n=1 Tax=Fusarium proliferatum (strain ET1) TaxID=1227346 RepID=A0A1L7WA75_FUSPR|nr:uncharacterized protein FPRO_11289 [Fusarium proliferatum ET1]XP_031085566.1 uncharacterized protein FPRO_15793 [Fusarium proliferatum ET1]XP_031089884.1 uncharacterized protein FPRO_08877 [Fusarium proliferatum ET1]XP_031090221.1 uncharacterized protein FPRO_16085 [Fusarium proliferatum ET1]CZR41699.1 uncharacterized protein FPRO_11289 [Fusarium proliferatum ET1]CZR45032.1 uncharacterized protein FPRO_15793 [Fusarium proliferatum ET1]CZR49382.1 uncharacterized protein FPRO_08877 [Fusarium